MPQTVDQPGMARIRLGAWMMIAGTLGAILALLTWIDVWDASDTKPAGWALAAAAVRGAGPGRASRSACKGLQEKSQAAAAQAPPRRSPAGPADRLSVRRQTAGAPGAGCGRRVSAGSGRRRSR